MSLTLEQARKKHKVEGLKDLRNALEHLGDKEKFKELKKKGALAPQLFDGMNLDAEMHMALAHGITHPSHSGDESITKEEDLINLENYDDFTEEWNAYMLGVMDRIGTDNELDDKVKKALVNEIKAQTADINGTISDVMYQRADWYKQGIDQVKETFDDVMDELVENHFGDRESDLVLHYAKRLFAADGHRFFRLPEEVREGVDYVGDIDEDEEDNEGPPLTEEIVRAHTADWNVRQIFKSEKVEKFLDEKREETMKKWGIEPMKKAQEHWIKVGKLLEKHKQNLIKKGWKGEELERKLDEKHEELAAAAQKKIDAISKKKGVKALAVGEEIFGVPLEKVEEFKEFKPPEVMHKINKNRRKEPFPHYL